MSNRTIMEFNHDKAHEIEERSEEFLEALGAVMRGWDKQAIEILQQRFGVTVGRSRHHSEDMKPDVLALFGGRQP